MYPTAAGRRGDRERVENGETREGTNASACLQRVGGSDSDDAALSSVAQVEFRAEHVAGVKDMT